jgi:ferritin-like metal-binding protein YciE
MRHILAQITIFGLSPPSIECFDLASIRFGEQSLVARTQHVKNPGIWKERFPIRLYLIARIEDTMHLDTLKDLYIHELKDLHSVEKQLIAALPKMAKTAKSDKLGSGFREHLEQTKGHAARLEKILAQHGQSTRGKKCKGMEGIIAEGAELIEEEADPEVKDAGLIAAAQRVEHYEIAGYGTARTYAEILGDQEGARLLQETLKEEQQTDEKLTSLAKTTINPAAAR